jgi:chemotaxis methyl-accepting protein methylase
MAVSVQLSTRNAQPATFITHLMDDEQFRQLLYFFGLSWSGYRKVRKGVKKRVSRHMQSLGCRQMSIYLHLLHENPRHRRDCEQLMTVSISRFFRDRQLWTFLESNFLPEIAAGPAKRIAVWSAGCASGEEVYSFKIIWESIKAHRHRLPALEVLATDRNPEYIQRARAGIFNASSLRDVPDQYLETFFNSLKSGKRYRIIPALHTDIIWKTHDFFSDSPQRLFEIIFLRNNLLTYYRNHLARPALQKIISCLAPAGLLIIGARERLQFEATELVPVAPFAWIFQKHWADGGG